MSTSDTPMSLIKNLPSASGVYLFKDQNGQILYVGKAKDLKKRVGSYFTKQHTDRPWTTVLVGLIADIETIVVKNETEALMLEATLIKQHMPRFNIKLTDDKAYPYIKVVTNEPVPRFFVTRRQTNDKALYFGPYLSARSASRTLEFLRTLHGIHISNKPLRQNRDRACLNCQLTGFSCPLNNEVDEEKYRERTHHAIEFLQGKRKSAIADLEERMREAAEKEQFELAAKMRDRLQAVRHILENQKVISTSLEDYDAIGTATSPNLSAVSVLNVREGRVVGQKAFLFTTMPDHSTAELLRNFLVSVYQHFSEIPPTIVTGEEIAERENVEKLLAEISNQRLSIKAAQRGDKRQIVEMAGKNARAKLETRLLRTDQAFTGVVALGELLKLPELPTRIEAVDISNLGTSEPVGATICFINGQPDKNEYRRYKIKTVEGQNDFAMIREVVARRFSDTTRPAPDLFVVDGGIEQLKFALQGLENAPTQPKAVIALAKKPDRIFLPQRKMPIAAPRGNKGLLLLARLRDEVHRYVISFQRERQKKRSLSTFD